MVSWVTVLCSVALVLSRLKHTWCVSADDFLPYGTEHGDSDLEHATVNVPLPQSFTFLGETFSAVHVSINGALTWGSAPGVSAVTPMQDVKLIAPYFGDVDATYGGNVFYRSTNDSALLERVSAIITANFDGLSEGLPLRSLFIATWHRIPANGGPVDKHNTFQCVLAYNAQSGSGSESDSPGPRVVSDPMSFALFLYEDGGIQWSRGQGENAKHAQVGFSNGNGRYLILPTSRTDAVLEVAATGNTGVVGQWLFRVDGAQVVLPAPLVGLEHIQYSVSESAGSLPVCVRIHAGEPSRDFSLALHVNGQRVGDVSFQIAGPIQRCINVSIVNDSVVEYDETLTVELLGADVSYPTILPSTAVISIVDDDVEVGWEHVDYSVAEDGGAVELCVMAVAAQLSRDVVVNVTFGRSEDSASRTDYTAVDTELTFQQGGSRRLCTSVPIVNDNIVENNETLTVTLSTKNASVTSPTATVTILDDIDVLYIRPPIPVINIVEDYGVLLLCILIAGERERNFNVGFKFNDDSAQAGVHYVNTSGVITIAPPPHGNPCTQVHIVDNDVFDIDGRDFSATLYSSDPSVQITEDTYLIHIGDNDASRVQFSFSQAVFTGYEGDNVVSVCAELSEGRIGVGKHVDLNITTRTAAYIRDRRRAFRGQDYGDAERVVRFDSTSRDPLCVDVPIIDDDVLEDRETFLVETFEMDKTLGYSIRPRTVRVVLEDNDSVTATVENTQVMVDEGIGTSAKICVLINGDREIDLDLRATPSPENATAGTDYSSIRVDFTLDQDDTRTCTDISIINDFKLEALFETFLVDVSAVHPRVHFNESRVRVFIRDRDTLIITPFRSLQWSSIDEVNNVGRFCAITSGELDIEVEVSIHTLDATATAGEDYIPFNKTRVIGPQNISDEGTSLFCTQFYGIDDIIVEGTESFFVVMTPISNRVNPFQPGGNRIEVTIADDDVVRVVPSYGRISVNEGDGHARICATMIGLIERPIDITMTTIDGTAREGIDYALEGNSIHFTSYRDIYGHLNATLVAEFSVNPPRTEACANITILDDAILERITSKDFTVHFDSRSLPRERMMIESGVTVTILDDDNVVVALDRASLVVDEAAQRARIQLSLDGEADYAITASIQTRPVAGKAAATPDDDYIAVEDGVVIPAHYRDSDLLTNELTIPIRDDDLLEDLEGFEVQLESASPGVLLGEPHISTIWIEDNDYVEVGLSDGEFRVLENAEFASVCCELIGALGKSVTVNITSSPGTARNGTDYLAPPSQFLFPPSPATLHTQCIDFQLIDDDRLEAVESFYVTISTLVPRVTVGLDTATVSLVDNDGVYVTLVTSEHSVEEDGGGEVEMCVQMTGVIEREVMINLFTEADTAHADDDFVAANRMIVFPPSDLGNQTNCTSFNYLDDNTVEATERFYVRLATSGPGNESIEIVINRARVSIIDSDTVSVDFERFSYSVTEEDEEVIVCVDLGADVEKRITVQFTTAAASAQHYSDFLQNDSQLIFEPRTTTRACTPIVIMNDELLEDKENFTVYILISDPALFIRSNTESSNSSAVVTIGDNDHVSVSLESSVYTVAENVTQLSVCSTLRGATGKSIPLTFSSQPGTAKAELDYSAPVREFVFLPSAESQQTECVEVLVVDDDILEDIETFHLEITTAVPRVTLTLSAATVSVVDDDSVYVTLMSGEHSVEEDGEGGQGGEVEVCVQQTGVIEKAVVVELFTEADTAHAGVDFGDSHHYIQFSPSPADNQTMCVTFSVLHDTVVESTETFLVKLTASDAFVTVNISEAVVSILDSDSVSVDFEQSAYSVSEGKGGLSVCVELGAEVERLVTVQLTTSDATALGASDFTQTDTELSFQPLATTHMCTAIHVENDDILENEEHFLLNLLTADSALYTSGGGTNSSVVVTVSDNDSVNVSLVRDEQSVEEEGGEVEVCVQLMGVIEREVVVTVFTEADTAHADADYVAATYSVLFYPTRSESQVNCTTFSIINDDTVEKTESFIIQLIASDDRIIAVDARARIFINDTDLVDVDFDRSMYPVSEGAGEVSVCVELGAEVERMVTIRLVTDEDTAQRSLDFTQTYAQITFEPRGNAHQCIGIPIIDNDILENEEQFFVYIFDSDRSRVVDRGNRGDVEVEVGSGGVEVITGGVQRVVVISDDDSVRIGVEMTQYQVEESEEVRVCLKVFEGEMARSVDVTAQTAVGTAKAGLDYFHVSRVVTFESSGQKWCVRVQLVNDPEVERDKTFTIQLSSNLEGTAVVLDPKLASILIIDDDVVCVEDLTKSPRGNYLWKEVRPGLIELPCQYGEEGKARRHCNKNGKWEEVNLEECFGETKDLFPYLEKMPFNCKNFHELLRAVKQATAEKDFDPYYVAVVARFFRDFADIAQRDGYIVEEQRCLEDVNTFTVGVMIIDELFVWPREILWTNSTSIIRDFEAVSEQLVAKPESAYMTLPLNNIAFSSSSDERRIIEKDGVMREFSANRNAPLKIASEADPSNSDILGSIQLPSSLFVTLDKEVTKVGVWFSLHKRGIFFPLPDTASVNDSVSTPVISATVGGQTVQDLQEPIVFSLRLLKKSVTDPRCASWDHEEEDWTISGCETVSVKDGYVTCSCTHLTNFAGLGASLIRPEAVAPRDKPSLTLSIISMVGTMLALLALTLTLFTLLAFGKLRRRRSTILRAQLCVSLLVLLLAYVGHIIVNYTSTLPQDIPASCVAISVFTHYFTLTSLVWMGAEALLMFRKVVFGKRLGDLSNLYFGVVSVTSWLVPFPLAAIPAVLNQDWMVTEDEYCFISSLPVFLATFAVPAGITLVFNLIVYLAVMSLFIKRSCEKPPPLTERKKRKSKSRRKAIIQLLISTPAIATFFILTWIFGSLTFVTSEVSLAFHLLSALFSALLGWFIFIYYIVTAKETRKLVHNAFCGKQQPNLNVNQFLSMESLGRASGIDESDSDSDYPERERRYGEFDVTYIDRKGAFIEQKFTIGFKADGDGDGDRDGDDNGNNSRAPQVQDSNTLPAGSVIFSAPLTDDDKSLPVASTSQITNRTHVDSDHREDGNTAILEDPKSKSSESSGGSPPTSEEDVDSDEYKGSPQALASKESFLPPTGEVGFTKTPET